MTSQTPDHVELTRIEKAVLNLPRVQRYVFLAHRLDSLTYAEIAGRTGLTRSGVQKQMARAIYNIERQMRGHQLRWWQRWF